MAEDPTNKDSKKRTIPKVVVTQKPKKVNPHGLPDEITPQPTRHVVQNPIESGVNPAKHLKDISDSDYEQNDILENIKPKQSPQHEQAPMSSAPITNEKTIEIHKSSGPAWLAFMLALFSMGGVGAIAYWGLQSHQQILALNTELKVKEVQQQQFAQNIQSQLNDVGAIKSEQEGQIKAFHQLKKDVQNTQTNMLRISGDSQWLLSEAHYLSSIALERLNSNQDISTATLQLESAMYKISQIGDAQLSSVKRVLEQDIHALKTVAIVDSMKLWRDLDDISRIVPLLRTNDLISKEQQVAHKSDDSNIDEKSDWQTSLKKSWQEFKGLVRVTHYDQEEFAPILDANSQDQLLRSMGLMIEQAKWAVLQQEQSVYDESLSQLKEWTQKFFIDQGQTKNLLEKLSYLQSEQITQSIPDISGSKFALKEAVSNLNKRGHTTIQEPVL
jgi:uroporphyrin-3 C-methyltransferase